MWLANGSMESMLKEQGTRISLGKFKKFLQSWWKRGAATPISNIDNFVKHSYREHNQEADHWADIGAQGRRKIDIYGKDEPVVSGMEASKTMAGAAAKA